MKTTTVLLIGGAAVAAYFVAKRLKPAEPKPQTTADKALGVLGGFLGLFEKLSGNSGAKDDGGGTAKSSTRMTRPPVRLGVIDLDEPSYVTNSRQTGGGGALVW